MKISYKGDYALKALFALALRHDEKGNSVLSIQEIARVGDMPVKFLEQILLSLKNGGFVNSKRGINGGFSLAKHPSQITVGDVVRFIEGPIEPISCVEENYRGCKDLKNCILRDVFKEAARAVSLVIDTVNFEELAVRYKEKTLNLKPSYEYSI
jgi:Rrf2 family protein